MSERDYMKIDDPEKRELVWLGDVIDRTFDNYTPDKKLVDKAEKTRKMLREMKQDTDFYNEAMDGWMGVLSEISFEMGCKLAKGLVGYQEKELLKKAPVKGTEEYDKFMENLEYTKKSTAVYIIDNLCDKAISYNSKIFGLGDEMTDERYDMHRKLVSEKFRDNPLFGIQPEYFMDTSKKMRSVLSEVGK